MYFKWKRLVKNSKIYSLNYSIIVNVKLISDVIKKKLEIFLARKVFRIQSSNYEEFFCENS